MSKILEAKKVCKDGILFDVSLCIEDGEMAAIMGPSGSGKSTLLYQVSGLDRPTSGEVLFQDTDITKLKDDNLSKLRLQSMGFVFQQMNMLKNLSIADNILLPASALKKEKEAAGYADELMGKMGISDLKGRKITEVSGGQLQRACICRAMINHPKILFADEPTGALNQSSTGEVMDELLKLNKEHMTILMVTHDAKVAGKCDRILYLMDGKIHGELSLGKWSAYKEKAREEEVSNWLKNMGW